MGYNVIQLRDIDSEKLEKIFESFSSINEDVEDFFIEKIYTI